MVIGLFLGVRVLWKFSSDLKKNQTEIDKSIKLLTKINDDLKINSKLTQSTKMESAKTLSEFKKTEEKIFGKDGNDYSNSSTRHTLDAKVEELEDKMKEFEEKMDDVEAKMKKVEVRITGAEDKMNALG